jgi:hypothetical protein
MYLSAQNKEENRKKAPLGKREKVCMEKCRKGTVSPEL